MSKGFGFGPNVGVEAHMVACAGCGLLVGWAADEPPRFLCIPCFDTTPLHEEDNSDGTPE